MLLRGFLAIVAGMIVVTAASFGADVLLARIAPAAFDSFGRVNDPSILVALVGFGAVVAALAGWTVAAIARGAELRVAAVFALLLLAISALGALQGLDTAPLWYHASSVTAVTVAVFVGAWIRRPRRIGQRQSALLTHSPTK